MFQFYIFKKDRNRGKKNCLSVAWDRSFWRLFQWRLLTSYLIMPNWHNSFLKKRTANWRLSTAETCTLWNGVGTGLITIRKVHSVNLGCLWYLRCYHAKEVLHISQNRFAPDEIFSRTWRIQNALVQDSFRRLHVYAWNLNPKTKVNT